MTYHVEENFLREQSPPPRRVGSFSYCVYCARWNRLA